MLSLILKENSFQFNGKNYLQIHGTAMGTKMAVAFANIFMANIETEILSNSVAKPTIWKRYIDDIFSLWDVSQPDIDKFIEQANSHHPTIKFTAEISNTETTFLDTVVYKGKRFRDQSILDIKTHFKGGFYLNFVQKSDFLFSVKSATLTIKVYIRECFGCLFSIFLCERDTF